MSRHSSTPGQVWLQGTHPPGTARLLHALRQGFCRGSCVGISINKAVHGRRAEAEWLARTGGGTDGARVGPAAACLPDEWLGLLITQLDIPLPQEVMVGWRRRRRRRRSRAMHHQANRANLRHPEAAEDKTTRRQFYSGRGAVEARSPARVNLLRRVGCC
ncbi:hypothetical protein E2C01_036779 [Portunus trituberculatus]|uniref:Uncharacterized protein n=1 Tax=Portunus trituberculatus TaxID=210409 RepID=A0A5B7F9L9_PORTR|nr:hypothetical protein [Portunus trituberculatus]